MSASSIMAGGCGDGIVPVVQGWILKDEPPDCNYYCFPVHVRSPDFDATLTVDLIDLALFAQHFPTPYDDCYDLNMDGILNLVDVAIFASHYLHFCQ